MEALGFERTMDILLGQGVNVNVKEVVTDSTALFPIWLR